MSNNEEVKPISEDDDDDIIPERDALTNSVRLSDESDNDDESTLFGTSDDELIEYELDGEEESVLQQAIIMSLTQNEEMSCRGAARRQVRHVVESESESESENDELITMVDSKCDVKHNTTDNAPTGGEAMLTDMPDETNVALAKRKLIQEVMKDKLLSPQERHQKMQDIMAGRVELPEVEEKKLPAQQQEEEEEATAASILEGDRSIMSNTEVGKSISSTEHEEDEEEISVGDDVIMQVAMATSLQGEDGGAGSNSAEKDTIQHEDNKCEESADEHPPLLAAEVVMEDYSSDDKVNQMILNQLRGNIEFDYLLVRKECDRKNEYDYICQGDEDLNWLGHFIGWNTALRDLRLEIVPTDSFCLNVNQNKTIQSISFQNIDLSKGHIFQWLCPLFERNNLHRLVISGCVGGTECASSITSSLKKCSSLKEISLIHNQMQIEEGEMCDILEALPNLELVTLKRIDIGPDECRRISVMSNRLRKLDLSGCSIGDEGVQALCCEGACHYNLLTSLDLSKNSLTDRGAGDVVTLLSDSSNLHALNLSGNSSIGDQGIEALLSGFQSNSQLKSLNLSNIPMLAKGIESLAEYLGSSGCSIEHLHLANCNVGEKGARTLANGLALNHMLKTLNLGHLGRNATQLRSHFYTVLCNKDNIIKVFLSNHVLESLGVQTAPDFVSPLLTLNRNHNKCEVAARKIIMMHHQRLGMDPIDEWEMKKLPFAVSLLGRTTFTQKLEVIYKLFLSLPEVFTFESAPQLVCEEGAERTE